MMDLSMFNNSDGDEGGGKGEQKEDRRIVYDHWFEIQKGRGKEAVADKDAKNGLGRIRIQFERLPADQVWEHLTEEERSAAEDVPASLSGMLRIRLRGAKHLIPADFNLLRGKSSDPYTVMEVDGVVKKSRVVRKSLHPDWDQSFAFDVKSLATSKLRLQVMDYDVTSAHDPLGHATIDLRPLHDLQTHQLNVVLEGVKSGVVMMDIRFLESLSAEDEEEDNMEPASGKFKEGRGVPTGLTLASPPLRDIAAAMHYPDDPRVIYDMDLAVSQRLSKYSAGSRPGSMVGMNRKSGIDGLDAEGASPRILDEDPRSLAIGHVGGFFPSTHDGVVTGADFSPCGRKVVTTGTDRTLRLWNSMTGKGIATMAGGHTQAFTCCRYSPQGDIVLAGNVDSSLTIWDLKAKSLRAELPGHTRAVTSCDIEPEGVHAISTAEDGQMRLWRVGGGDRSFSGSGKMTMPAALVIKGAHGVQRQAAFLSHSGGSKLVGGGDDMHLRMWDMQRLQSLQDLRKASQAIGTPEVLGEMGLTSELLGHSAGIRCVATAPETPYLAVSGSHDKVIRVWDLRQRESPGFFHVHDDTVTSLKFLPGDQVIASCSVDTTLRMLDLRVLSKHQTGTGEKTSFGVRLRRREELGAIKLSSAAFALAVSRIPITQHATVTSGAFLCLGDASGHVGLMRATPGAFGPLRAAHFVAGKNNS
uniref:C2 domain-containing protein n=1 Tax=Palpitomonas bilix TaxID=652834 RepID=A0A7S3CY79_9EUKA